MGEKPPSLSLLEGRSVGDNQNTGMQQELLRIKKIYLSFSDWFENIQFHITIVIFFIILFNKLSPAEQTKSCCKSKHSVSPYWKKTSKSEKHLWMSRFYLLYKTCINP